jgi:WD40 repeat protein
MAKKPLLPLRPCLLIMSFALLATVSYACAPSAVPSPTVVPEPSPTPTTVPTVRPQHTTTPTPTSLPDTFRRRCAQNAIEMPPANEIAGRLALEAGSPDEEDHLLVLPSMERITLSIGVNMAVSPSGRYMVYSRWDPYREVIINSNGLREASFPDPSGILTPVEWLDDKHIVMNRKTPVGIGQLYTLDPVIINPFAGTLQNFGFEFPDLFRTSIPERPWDTDISINPLMTHIVYLALDEGYSPVLWDIAGHTEVARLRWGNYVFGASTPSWSPDGTRVATVSWAKAPPSSFSLPPSNPDAQEREIYGLEIFAMGLDGSVTRMTTLWPHEYVWDIGGLSWSPDGRTIAFWLRSGTDQSQERRLATLDVATGIVTDLCTTIGHDILIAPQWSPDSRWLALNWYDHPRLKLYVLNPSHGLLVEIPEVVWLGGWMSEPAP